MELEQLYSYLPESKLDSFLMLPTGKKWFRDLNVKLEMWQLQILGKNGFFFL